MWGHCFSCVPFLELCGDILLSVSPFKNFELSPGTGPKGQSPDVYDFLFLLKRSSIVFIRNPKGKPIINIIKV